MFNPSGVDIPIDRGHVGSPYFPSPVSEVLEPRTSRYTAHCVAFFLGTWPPLQKLQKLWSGPALATRVSTTRFPPALLLCIPSGMICCGSPQPPPPQAQVPMTRQKAPWARRAGAGWRPGGARRHTPSGGKPVPARWGVLGGGSRRDWPSHTKTRVHDASASSRKRVPPVGARSGARKCAPPGRRCPRSERHFLFFWRSRRASREEAEDSPGPARESGPAGA